MKRALITKQVLSMRGRNDATLPAGSIEARRLLRLE